MPDTQNFDHLPDMPMGGFEPQDLMQGPVNQQTTDTQTDEESASTKQNTDEQTPAHTPQQWELDGELIPQEQAREWLSKGRDATRKWQEAADLKREAEAQLQRVQWADELERIWSSGPEGQRRVIEGLQQQAGYQPTTQTQQELGIAQDELSDEGRFLLQQNTALKQELNQTRQQMAKALESLEQYVGEQRTGDQAAQTAARLKSEWGVDVQPSQLREAVKRTGIQDMEGAWLKENKALLRTAPGAAPQVKPNTPQGHDKTFDPNSPEMSADRMFNLLLKGYQPSA